MTEKFPRRGSDTIGMHISLPHAGCSDAARIKKKKDMLTLKRHLNCTLHGKIYPTENFLMSETR